MLNTWPFQVRLFLSNHKESVGKGAFKGWVSVVLKPMIINCYGD
jgi:hypothetical protein